MRRSSHKLKVLDSVIGLDFILMVDYFRLLKITSKMFFHYKAVLEDIASFMLMRVGRRIDSDVPRELRTSTFPSKATCPFVRDFIKTGSRANDMLSSSKMGFAALKLFITEHTYSSHGQYYKPQIGICL